MVADAVSAGRCLRPDRDVRGAVRAREPRTASEEADRRADGKASKRGADLEAARSKLSALDGIENLEEFLSKAKANAETVASLADKDRENEAAIQKRIAEAVKAATSPITAERDTLKGELSKMTEGFKRAVVGNAFLNSQFAREKLKNPALAERLFAGCFAVRDGKPVGRDADGNDLYGADGVATFDEALHKLVSSSPFKDDLLKSPAGGCIVKQGGQRRYLALLQRGGMPYNAH